MMAAAAKIAVDDELRRIDSQRTELGRRNERLCGEGHGAAMKVQTADLHERMTKWETQMSSQIQTQMKAQIQQHWNIFEKKWEGNNVQLEPGICQGSSFLGRKPHLEKCSMRPGESVVG